MLFSAMGRIMDILVVGLILANIFESIVSEGNIHVLSL